MEALLLAHRQKRISVYVTEARPRGAGFVPHPVLAKQTLTYEGLDSKRTKLWLRPGFRVPSSLTPQ